MTIDRILIGLPEWQEVGVVTWANYSRSADLCNGSLLYPALAIGGALFSFGAAVSLIWWKESTRYAAPDYWVFASLRRKGERPLRPEGVPSKVIRPAAMRAGIKKRIGFYTFRHTYSSTLIANGENVKVVQELMRHASTRFTLDTQAKARAKRDAQQRIVEMMLPKEGLASDIRLQHRQPNELLGDGD